MVEEDFGMMLSYLAGLGPDPCFETQNPKPTTQNPKGIQLWTGSPDVFAHTLQFTGDADSLRGGEKVTFVPGRIVSDSGIGL